MCRIAGSVCRSEKGARFSSDRLNRMLDSMAHGGPDDEGTYSEDGLWLGHRRLSIIDLSADGHQPMCAQNKVLVFNGEIYNYRELRADLQKEGVIFTTQTDTEVILKGYAQWGTSLFAKLEGIFAFALFDKERKSLTLVRDPIGVKPLYYSLTEDELIFSSEVRAFKSLDPSWKERTDWKILFLAFGSIPSPFTTLEGVVQLLPGTFLTIDLPTFSSECRTYFKFGGLKKIINSETEALGVIRGELLKSVSKNMVCDAPLGIFLSGGIDSSLLALLADKLSDDVHTLSVNFDESEFDEHYFQQLVLEKTKNVEHISHRVSEKMFWSHLDDVWKAMDQPSVDGINSYFVARCAKMEGIKAVLSGIGADEFFGGYSSFNRIRWIKLLRRMPIKNFVASLLGYFKKPLSRITYLYLPGPIGDYLFLRGIFTPSEIASQLQISESEVWQALKNVPIQQPPDKDPREYASFLESNLYLTGQLLKDADYMGMWHGVEVRVPFLDTELLKQTKSIHPNIRYNKSRPKFLITASYNETLPSQIIFRKKKGFTFPFLLWLKRAFTKFEKFLPDGKISKEVFHDFLNGSGHWSRPWALAVMHRFGAQKLPNHELQSSTKAIKNNTLK